MPCTANFGLPSAVAARPSGPPSFTWIWPSCTIARSPSRTAPGTIAFAVVRDRARPADVVRGAGALHRDREREVDHRRRVRATARVDAVEPVRHAQVRRAPRSSPV